MAAATQVISLGDDRVVATINYDDATRIVTAASVVVQPQVWARVIVWKATGNLWFDQTYLPSPIVQSDSRTLTNPQRYNIDTGGVLFSVSGG